MFDQVFVIVVVIYFRDQHKIRKIVKKKNTTSLIFFILTATPRQHVIDVISQDYRTLVDSTFFRCRLDVKCRLGDIYICIYIYSSEVRIVHLMYSKSMYFVSKIKHKEKDVIKMTLIVRSFLLGYILLSLSHGQRHCGSSRSFKPREHLEEEVKKGNLFFVSSVSL